MKMVFKTLRLLGLFLIMSMASLGVGINGAILPTFRTQDSTGQGIELVEHLDNESEIKELEDQQ